MARRPQFKPGFRCEIVLGEGVFLLSEKEHFLLRGEAYVLLAPFLDGMYTEEEIVRRLAGQLPVPQLFYALERLRQKGYVVDACSTIPAEQAAFWGRLDQDPATVSRRLAEMTVAVRAFGRVEAGLFKDILGSLGIRLVDQGDCWVALTDDYLQAGLVRFNQERLSDQRPWLLVKPVGSEVWLGPLFVPGETGCWACLAHRLKGQRKVESYLQEKKNTPDLIPRVLAGLPSTLQVALGLAATEIAKWLVCGENKNLVGQVMTLDTVSLEKRSHTLVRRPQCPVCGNPAAFTTGQAAPLSLPSQLKSFTADGGHRLVPPQETFQRLEHHVSPVTGIVGGLQRVSLGQERHELLPTYIADHNFVLVDDELYFLRENIRSRSAGKGKSDIQAKVSALGESIERYSGVFQGDEARVRARYKELGGAIHPNACMLFSQRQFQERARWNQNGSRFNWVPEPFEEDLEIEWSPVWSLTHHEPRYVPTAYCYYGYSRRARTWFARADANGCAAGNGKTEAILQGFMELVERDSVAIWWYNRLKKPAVDLASFNDPYFAELLAYYRDLRRDLWVLDITGDLGIPTFAAISRRCDKAAEDILFAFGAHFDPSIALLRALTELNQMLPAVFAGTPDYNYQDAEAVAWWTTATIANQPYLIPDASQAPKVQADYPRLWSDDLLADVQTCVRLAQEKGLETLVLDQTRPDAGLHVVKVIVPGLRHFWARLAPGRLYDVPVQMGWLAKPFQEEELNPRPIFL